jgi:hypothetical protein
MIPTTYLNPDADPGPDALPDDVFQAQVRVQHPVRTYTNELPFGFVEIGGVRIRSYADGVRQQFRDDLRDRIDSIEEALAIGQDPAALKAPAKQTIAQLKVKILADFLELEVAERALDHIEKALTVRRAQSFSNS